MNALGWFFLLTGVGFWAMLLLTAVVLAVGVAGERAQRRRSAKILAEWARLEDERRARRQAEWDMHVEAEIERVILESKEGVK